VTTNANPPLADLVMAGMSDQDAVEVGDRIFMSRGVSNSYLVGTSEGALLVNTGLAGEASRHHDRFARVSDAAIATIVFTQSHGDHVGGWSTFSGPGVETIAQSNFFDVRGYWSRLGPFYGARSARLWSSFVPQAATARPATPAPTPPVDPVPTVVFGDTYEFELGDRRVELHAVPGGETTDSLLVWLPDERTVFTGNLMGPMYGHVPNLYTIRGDKIRSALEFVRSVDRLRSLEPEVVITGHGDPITGAEQIAADLTKLRDAVLWVHDATVAGMNAGTDLFTLMRDITPPPALELGQGHGKVAWNVRATWEEYAGWFRYESTTELYPVPPSAIWPDLVELAGGASAIVDRAAAHLAAGRPVEALHLTDMVLAADATDRAALAVSVAALELLLERSGRANLSETRWLDTEITAGRTALGD
jgi:alkyl sulfatase BDS1-like metallo-beta-lactamase superfamily hydrolase